MINNDMRIRTEDLLHNPTNRVPIVLCLDVSGSMAGAPINELNNGVKLFFDVLHADTIATASAEIAIVSFNDQPNLVLDFQGLARINQPPMLTPSGSTDLGGGIDLALSLLDARKREYQNTGVDYFQPWLILMTDGAPTTTTHQQMSTRVCQLEGEGRLVVFPIGIGIGADMVVLGLFSRKRQPLRLQGLNFKQFFEWLSKSVVRVSQSRPGEKIQLDMEGIKGWAEI